MFGTSSLYLITSVGVILYTSKAALCIALSALFMYLNRYMPLTALGCLFTIKPFHQTSDLYNRDSFITALIIYLYPFIDKPFWVLAIFWMSANVFLVFIYFILICSLKLSYLFNVLYKRATHPSELRTSKLTKKWKNRTLISRQPLNNN